VKQLFNQTYNHVFVTSVDCVQYRHLYNNHETKLTQSYILEITHGVHIPTNGLLIVLRLIEGGNVDIPTDYFIKGKLSSVVLSKYHTMCNNL